MVTDDVGFDVLVTRSRLEQWLLDNGFVPTTDPPTTASMVAWDHVGLHGVPSKHLVDGAWVDAPCCRVSPCKAAGVSFAIFELDQYLGEASLERSQLVDALDRLASGLKRFETAARQELLRVHRDFRELAQRSRANLVSPAFHVAAGRGRRQVPLLDAITQHLCENGFSYAEVAGLVVDGVPGDSDAAPERVRKRAANPERRSLFPAQQDPEPTGIK
jgi:hypothetical protein